MAIHWRKDIYLLRLDTHKVASFSHDLGGDSRVIRSSLTNYVFVNRPYTVEAWDVSVTGSKLIWETNPPTTSPICSTCSSQDGHRLLIGYDDGSVKMWEPDLENSAMNQADTVDTQADANIAQFIAFSHSGKMVITKSYRSHCLEFLDTVTGEVVARTDFDDDMEIAFSPDEDEAAFLSGSLITIFDIMRPENRVSFNLLPRKDVLIGKIAFQTCNDLVMCAILCDGSGLLQVWHRQNPTLNARIL